MYLCLSYNNIVFSEYDPIYTANGFPSSFKYAKYNCIWPQYEEDKLSLFDLVGPKFDMHG